VLDVNDIRARFPALRSGAIFLDGPGGTQVPQEVIDASHHYLVTANANHGGAFSTSERSDAIVQQGRQAAADFLHARSPEEIVFGQNMTSLTFHLSRCLGRTLCARDEIITTVLDHDANIAPWRALEERGVVIRTVDIDPDDCTLMMSDFERLLNARTEIVAVGYASNAVGTINDLKRIIDLAHDRKALVFVDAVHYAPHGPIDVQALDCDLLVCSAYKFFGPHVGVLYGKYDLLDRLPAYKVRPANDSPPHKFETGTQNHEGIAGITAAVDYLASIGERSGSHSEREDSSFTRRCRSLKAAMSAIQIHEQELVRRLISGLRSIPGVKIFGIVNEEQYGRRTPTVAFTMEGFTPRQISEYLAGQNIYVWDGHYYALAVIERLGLQDTGGAVRVGLVHYNTAEEVERLLIVLREIRNRAL
jgi:cysteine desulfurase family protein (TIGR01976 family)